MHPGVRVPFPHPHNTQLQMKDAANSKLSQTASTVEQAVEQLSYLIKHEVNQFDELASSAKDIYGVGVVYGGAHLNLESMLSRVSLDTPYGYEPWKRRIGSISCVLPALTALVKSFILPEMFHPSHHKPPSMSLRLQPLSRLNLYGALDHGPNRKRTRYSPHHHCQK
jgi:hypothetical protein